MSGLWAVTRREFLQRARSKWFVAVTLGAPVLMGGLIFVPTYMAGRGGDVARKIVLVDETGVVAERLAPKLVEARYEVVEEPWTTDAVKRLAAAVSDGEYGALLVIDDATVASGVATLHATSQPSPVRSLLLRTAVLRSAMEASLGDVDVDALLAGGELTVELLGDEAGTGEAAEFTAGFLGAMLLYMAIILWAVAVMRATLEEKRDRIAEIIVSAMKPWHLMLGKMIGVGAVGLVQLFVWGAAVTALVTFGLPTLLEARPEWSALERVPEVIPGPGKIALFIGFFVGGYFIFSGFYAAIGAMCNSEEEVGQVQIPVILLYMTPVLFLEPVVSDPTSTLATWLSLVPFFTPVLMWPRVSVGAAPAWQIVLSYALMLIAIVAVAWLAGRIYKVGMLMAGKRPTLPELWRWMREA